MGFKEPNIIRKTWGKINVDIDLKIATNLPATSSAMDDIAQSEFADEAQFLNGENDYIGSFSKLMNGFDTFIKESKINKKICLRTGDIRNYDLRDSSEFTIYLVWQLRNIATHNGNLVDQECKEKYENAYSGGEGTQPIISSLTSTIQIGKRFYIPREDYYNIRNAIFQYIEKRIPVEDWKILFFRSANANKKIDSFRLAEDFNGFSVVINADDVIKAVKEPIPNGNQILLPPYILDMERRRLIFKSDGTAIPFKLIKITEDFHNHQQKSRARSYHKLYK